MMRDHKPISIADQVFEKLERDILSGKYPQGEILSELRLSGELGVSRTPIREAIRRLEQERILEDSGHGLVVIGISRQDMLDIYEIRLQLEGLAAKRAAASITDDVLSEMKEVLDLQRFYIESEKEPGENSDQIKNLDSRFHGALQQLLEEHTAIYETLAAHDGDRAAEASLRHVENARANLADIIQKEG